MERAETRRERWRRAREREGGRGKGGGEKQGEGEKVGRGDGLMDNGCGDEREPGVLVAQIVFAA